MNNRPTPETDEEFADAVEATNSPSAKRIDELERDLAEARAQLGSAIAWSDKLADAGDDARAEAAGLLEQLALALAANADVARIASERDEAREALRQAHRDYGCELLDPNGTIWEYATKLQEQLAAERALGDRLEASLGVLRIYGGYCTTSDIERADESLAAHRAARGAQNSVVDRPVGFVGVTRPDE